jgi:hypothetical protein
MLLYGVYIQWQTLSQSLTCRIKYAVTTTPISRASMRLRAIRRQYKYVCHNVKFVSFRGAFHERCIAEHYPLT